MSEISSPPSFCPPPLSHLGAETGANTSARALYQVFYVSEFGVFREKKQRLKRRSVVDSDVFHVNRDVVLVWERVRRAIHRRVLFNQSLSHLVQSRLSFYLLIFRGSDQYRSQTHLNTGTLVRSKNREGYLSRGLARLCAFPCPEATCTLDLSLVKVKPLIILGCGDLERGKGVQKVNRCAKDPIIDLWQSRVFVSDEPLKPRPRRFEDCSARRQHAHR